MESDDCSDGLQLRDWGMIRIGARVAMGGVVRRDPSRTIVLLVNGS